MNNPSILTVVSDIAQDRIEIEIDGWGGDVIEVLHEGGPWDEARVVPFIEFQEHMMRAIAAGMGLTPLQHARLCGLKPCLSCGAIQAHDGTLPCDH